MLRECFGDVMGRVALFGHVLGCGGHAVGMCLDMFCTCSVRVLRMFGDGLGIFRYVSLCLHLVYFLSVYCGERNEERTKQKRISRCTTKQRSPRIYLIYCMCMRFECSLFFCAYYTEHKGSKVMPMPCENTELSLHVIARFFWVSSRIASSASDTTRKVSYTSAYLAPANHTIKYEQTYIGKYRFRYG